MAHVGGVQSPVGSRSCVCHLLLSAYHCALLFLNMSSHPFLLSLFYSLWSSEENSKLFFFFRLSHCPEFN